MYYSNQFQNMESQKDRPIWKQIQGNNHVFCEDAGSSLRFIYKGYNSVLPSFTNLRCFEYFYKDYIRTEMSEETH